MSVDKLTITSLNVDDTSNQLKILFGRDIEEKNQKEAISDDEKKKILKMTNFKWE